MILEKTGVNPVRSVQTTQILSQNLKTWTSVQIFYACIREAVPEFDS